MNCKSCKREVPDNAIFCCWCGEKLLKPKKKKDEISVPTPIKRGDRYFIRLRAENWCYTGDSAEECIIKAKAIRAGIIENKKTAPRMTVQSVIDRFLNDNSNILSPSTMRSYKSYYKTHLSDISNTDISSVNWQKRVNEMTLKMSQKTVLNVWRLVTAAMKYSKVEVPDIKMPKVVRADEPFLDFEQIKIFLKAVEGKEVELAALLALHSLRRSELMNLTAESIDRKKEIIHVRGARVQGEDNKLISKDSNKTATSARDVPIVIPRLLEILPTGSDGFIINCHPNRIAEKINTVCRHAGLPEVGVHGLRRSFASLAYHLNWNERTVMAVGGWSDIGTVHKFYIKLAKADISEQTESMREFFKEV